jgi:MoxR-like ATPase
MISFSSDKEALDYFHKKNQALISEIHKVIVGQDEAIRLTLNGIFSGGHCLLIGVPGLAKTLLINTIANCLGLTFSRIQFTPDLMPGDITGTEILDENRQFKFIKGPVFANILLADEINRTPPKTQSALLEAMQERQVTAAGKKMPLPDPFFVLATQNPIEQEGTYPLPEAQLDRFLFSIWMDYPSREEELNIVKQTTGIKGEGAQTVLSDEEIRFFIQLLKKMPVPEHVFEYAVNTVIKTRLNHPDCAPVCKQYLSWGAGPRASQNLIICAKTHAAMNGKYSVDKEDVMEIAVPVLRHRIFKNYKAEAEGIRIEDIITEILK